MEQQSAQLATLFAQYDRLCQYCDAVFQHTFQTFQAYMHCRKGCAACCLLETVVPLEAAVITSYLESLQEISEKNRVRDDGREPEENSPCVFLSKDQTCLIYSVRPIICRTHGLALKYPDKEDLDTCPLNFEGYDLARLGPQYVLDAEIVTTNLLRLNLAYCVLTETPETAGERIPLQTILSRVLSEKFTHDLRKYD